MKSKSALGRIPPQCLDQEMAVICSCLIDYEFGHAGQSAFRKVCKSLRSEDFYDRRHQLIWGAMESLDGNGDPIDILTVARRLEEQGKMVDAGGETYISSLSGFQAHSAHVKHQADVVRKTSVRRLTLQLMSNELETLYGNQEDQPLNQRLSVLSDNVLTLKALLDVDREITPAEAIDQTITAARERKNNPQSFLSTGIQLLDDQIGGLFAPDLIVIAGRASMGKTDLTLNILYNVASQGFPVAFASLEMGIQSVWERIICLNTGMFRGKLRTGKMDAVDEANLDNLVDLKKFPLTVRQGRYDMGILESWATERKHRNHIRLLAVDYLQIIRPHSDKVSREQQVSKISSSLKALALELNIPIIAVSQMSRAADMRDNNRPEMSDLRDSGSIEQDADVILMMYRDSYYAAKKGKPVPPPTKDSVEIHVKKNRQGATGEAPLVSYDRATGHIGRGEVIREEPNHKKNLKTTRSFIPEENDDDERKPF